MKLKIATKNGNREIVVDTDKIIMVEKSRHTDPIEISIQIYISDTMRVTIHDNDDSNYKEVYTELFKLGWIKDREEKI